MSGFGLQANVTVNDSEITAPAIGGVPERKIPLPGASDLVYNVSVYYERYGLSARLPIRSARNGVSRWASTRS